MQYTNSRLLSGHTGLFCSGISSGSKQCVADGGNVHRNVYNAAAHSSSEIRSGVDRDSF